MSQKYIFEKRLEFEKMYCEKKGWNPNKLTIDQILEIRSCHEWQHPE